MSGLTIKVSHGEFQKKDVNDKLDIMYQVMVNQQEAWAENLARCEIHRQEDVKVINDVEDLKKKMDRCESAKRNGRAICPPNNRKKDFATGAGVGTVGGVGLVELIKKIIAWL